MAASRRPDWRNGPEIPNQYTGEGALPEYPGQFLGLPKDGPGSQASVLRRMGGVFIDWVICGVAAWLITQNTHALGDQATVTYLLWIVLGIVCGWLFARTPGMAALGMGVARVDKEEPVGFWRAAVRTILTGFVLPAALVDADGRGMHDRVTDTTVIRA
ncbi:RDD family protein [Corynebacterium jeddahense]|uniref:RDD family protein n=1 Tax=Corynebacterium jeddahense TaxID=1414719 RepID=A0ABY7UKU6_9CORY|nr:RDD family protein [Corynebacterium jeddahense]WCZ39291.1 RDD family protein [Corynebacterium jeddahense]